MAEPGQGGKPEDEGRTEEPTSRKKEKAREQGSVAQSQELNSSFVLLSGVLILRFLGPWMFRGMKNMMAYLFDNLGVWRFDTIDKVRINFLSIFLRVGVIVVPFLFIIMLFGILISRIQVGNLWSVTALKPKWSQLVPKWSKLNIFKFSQSTKFAIDFAKLLVIGPVAYYTVKASITDFIPLMDKSLEAIWAFVLLLAFKVTFRIALLLVLLSGLDYWKQAYQLKQQLMMTKFEVKQERKDLQGDPMVKGWQYRKRKEMFQNAQMRLLPEADVVITNPTHYAIALKYDFDNMAAPKVIAKGIRRIAEKIKEIARLNDIPMVENKPLAQALYKTAKVGEEVPMEYYQAVAEILAYVYKLRPDKYKIPA